MGVLSDGTPFLTQRGLARLCGVQNAHIGTISTDWLEPAQKPRISAIKDLLLKHGVRVARPHIACKDGQKTLFAYPDTVCIAVLEYYAFEAGDNCKEEARDNFRLLAGKALRDFIYTQVGYDPLNKIPIAWQQFHDRVTAAYGSVPAGFFSVFKEAADLIVGTIRAGGDVGIHFVPDISIGQHWGRHWSDNDFDAVYGPRQKYPHSYPAYFPQALSNPQDAHCYPDAALPEFRRWMREVYMVGKLPPYLAAKVSQGVLPPSFSLLRITAYGPDA